MSTTITDADVAFFREQGYYIFRQIVPASLIDDLRVTARKALEIARKLNGPSAQRLQPLGKYPEIGLAPVKAFVELPELNEGVQRLLSPRHRVGGDSNLGLLFEPAEHSWAMEWHRDWRDHMSPAKFKNVFARGWETMAADLNLFNQINCALYEDSSTWFVPGTGRRLQDTPEEARAMKAADRGDLENRDRRRGEAAQEHFLHDYLTRMPGAVALQLQPGDLALYRSIAWHTGSYVPYRKRATLHCSAFTPEYTSFVKEAEAILAQ